MKLLYIAAPYRAKTIFQLQQNIHEAKLMAQYYWTQGYAVICPHLNTANFDGLMPDEVFLSGTMLMLSKCDCIAMHPNWTRSKGCTAEFEYALKENHTIFHPTYDEILTKISQYKEN